ncbi:ABC transporter permease [Sinorhizobium sp. BG8]|uniref:ABC transporter permease n=1 Tax=Sinorhizobium sp. BG8 TaxID=2613773 RepID=UPI00193DFAE1|nr:ABC transporter permease [Sinorhizobium sp. BG8]QRM56653.1 ABC transporter permease [Sinorhizobium sp. BG8]
MSTATLSSALPQPPERWWRSRTVRRFARHRLAMLGLVMIVLLTFACVFGPYLLPYDELFIDLRARFAPPFTGYHIFGTDPLGRDLAARLFNAGRISLLVGFFAMLLSTLIGTVIGVVAGYYGGRVGAVLMRFVDAFLSFPSIFLLLALAAFVKPSPLMITIIIAVTSWMEIARLVEAEVRSLRERDFVLAARMLGLSNSWIMFRELLPNAIGPIIVAATLTVARAILLEAYVSFLGYGIQPPLPSWGNMLNGAQQYLDSAPWLAIVPGIAITLAVTSFNFIGDGLRDALDARSDLN